AGGARRATLQAMRAALCVGQAGRGRIGAAHQALREQLAEAGQQVTLQAANSLWLDHSLSLLPEFEQLCAERYAAQTARLDFSAPEAAQAINDWVAGQTNQRINRLVSAQDFIPPPVMALLNAVYFKGAWEKPFDPALTRPLDFQLPGGGSKPLPAMHRTGSYSYLSAPQAQLASLPYAGGQFSLEVALPAPGLTLEAFLSGLTPAAWERWMDELQQTRLELALPRLRIEQSSGLNQALGRLGMGIAFSGEADFSDLSPEQLMISQVRHKAVLEVNEEGSQAAAATAVLMARGALPNHARLTVDRSFFCAIRHRPSGALLFAAAVYDPDPSPSN
ncbi:MAG: serpin family protein, partial [Chloroflexota bacterium]